MAIYTHTHTHTHTTSPYFIILQLHTQLYTISMSHQLNLVQKAIIESRSSYIFKQNTQLNDCKAEQCIVITADCDIGTLTHNGVNAQRVSRRQIYRYTKFLTPEPNKDPPCYVKILVDSQLAIQLLTECIINIGHTIT